jgi:hypothetical protein
MGKTYKDIRKNKDNYSKPKNKKPNKRDYDPSNPSREQHLPDRYPY